MGKRMALSMVISVVLVLLLAGCAAPEGPPEPAETLPEPAETLPELLDRVEGIASVKYDQVVTMPGEEESPQMKVWVKGDKMRSEITAEGQTVVFIIDRDAQVFYFYDPTQNIWIKSDLPALGEGAVVSFMSLITSMSGTEWAKLILSDPTKSVAVDSETVDGKVCLVVEGEEGKVRAWIWKVYGLPIRLEWGDIIIEWKNIEFISIPDDMFELPPGVEIKQQ